MTTIAMMLLLFTIDMKSAIAVDVKAVLEVQADARMLYHWRGVDLRRFCQIAISPLPMVVKHDD